MTFCREHLPTDLSRSKTCLYDDVGWFLLREGKGQLVEHLDTAILVESDSLDGFRQRHLEVDSAGPLSSML